MEAYAAAFARADHDAAVQQVQLTRLAYHGSDDAVRRFARRDQHSSAADAKFREAVRNIPL